MCVFDSIGAAEFDPRLLRESGQTEINFMGRLDVCRTRPNVPVIPTKWVDERGAKQLEYCSRLCEKELKRSRSNGHGRSRFGMLPQHVG